MPKTEIPLGFGGFLVPPGSHIASFYRNLSELQGIVAPFTQKGVEQGDRCICIVDDETKDELQEVLKGQGVDVEAALASGQLSIFTASDFYVRDGIFNPDRVVNLLQSEMERTLAKGYPALRVTGERTWALQEWPGAERLMEYEAKLHKILIRYPQVTLCQYNVTRFRGDVIVDALRVHPICIIGGVLVRNHFYVPPDEFLRDLKSRTH
jgi:hypothetical protein